MAVLGLDVHQFWLTLGGLAFLLLGIGVFLVRPHGRLNRAFAAFAIPFGVLWAWSNGIDDQLFESLGVRFAVYIPILVLTVLGALQLNRLLPGNVGRGQAPILMIAAAAALALQAAVVLGGPVLGLYDWVDVFPLREDGTAYGTAVYALMHVAIGLRLAMETVLWSLLLVSARLYANSRTQEDRRDLMLICVSFGLYLAYGSGSFVFALGRGTEIVAFPGNWLPVLVFLVGLAVVVLAWLHVGASRRIRPATAFGLALLAVAATAAVVASTTGVMGNFGYGLARILGALILAYAIVRHQAFGFDRKVRFTVKSTTLGAIFVAVFFVASEVAQQVFAKGAGPYVGIVAAGGLVFFLSPLQRMAERVATATVPVQEGWTVGSPRSSRTAVYGETARRLLADGTLSPRDELILAKLAQELGIGAADALEMRLKLQPKRRAPSRR